MAAFDIEAAAPRRLTREDFDVPPTWAAAGALAATGFAPIGAVLVSHGSESGRVAIGGLVGGLAVGSAHCLLDLALPPPGDCPRVVRNVFFTVAAVWLGPLVGTQALAVVGAMRSVDPAVSGFVGALGGGMVMLGAMLVAMPTLICRAMFVDPCL